MPPHRGGTDGGAMHYASVSAPPGAGGPSQQQQQHHAPHFGSESPGGGRPGGGGSGADGGDDGMETRTGEIKSQRACVSCRRSKVKCIHSGAPPCRRCADTRQECKFRLRADDETWREKTDDTLSRLASAVESLLHRGPAAPGPSSGMGNGPPAHAIPMPGNGAPHHRAPSSGWAASPPNPHRPGPPGSFANSSPSYSDNPPMGMAGPGSMHSGSGDPSSLPTPDHERSAGGPVPAARWERPHPYRRPTTQQAEDDGRGPPATTPGGSVRSPLQQALPTFRRLAAPPIGSDQAYPSPALLHVGATSAPFFLPQSGAVVRWTWGSSADYAKANNAIGRDDPRLNAISMGVVPMERARALYQLFAEKLQPHCFGFPTYPAGSDMTPLIISVILMCASMHDPASREEYYAKLKNDCLETIKPEQTVSADLPLDPEFGIGVEEITGACIAAAYLPSAVALRIGHITRWWALGYFKLFEIERNVTLGECLTILPPFRQIDLVDKLRVWLAAYVAEAQQCFIADVPSIAPTQSPGPYIEALRSAFAEQPSNGDKAANAASRVPPMPDRQLGAHAGVLAILLAAQQTQRESRSVSGTPAQTARRIANAWGAYLEEMDRWRMEAAALEDLSSSTASAMDLTLTYHLARAHIGSLALEPEAGMHPAAAAAAASDGHFALSQIAAVGAAKASALWALDLASSRAAFGDRLAYLPTFYHFLLSHCAGFLLLLVQRKGRFMLANEGRYLLEKVEAFVRVYVFEIAAYAGPRGDAVLHPSFATSEALSAALRHVQAQSRLSS